VMQISRRTFVSGTLVASAVALLPLTLRANPIKMDPVSASTPSTTPESNLPTYTGSLSDIWNQPWKTEGYQVAFKAIIIQRIEASVGQGFKLGNDGLVFRSFIHVEIPDSGYQGPPDAYVATNDVLVKLEGKHTVDVVGIYGGKNDAGGAWPGPLIIASSIRPNS